MAPDFERWRDAERARLKQVAQRAALDLSARHEDSRNVLDSVRWLRFAADLAPDDEAVVQRLIRVLDRTGDRATALRTYHSFAARMAAEFEREPSPETRALIAEIRARATSAAVPSSYSAADDHRREPAPAALPRAAASSPRPSRLMTLYLCSLLAISAAPPRSSGENRRGGEVCGHG
jgi:DNA-binding SARP family transcriptional activator